MPCRGCLGRDINHVRRIQEAAKEKIRRKFPHLIEGSGGWSKAYYTYIRGKY